MPPCGVPRVIMRVGVGHARGMTHPLAPGDLAGDGMPDECPSGRPHPRLVRPDRGENGPDLVGPSQPPQHPCAERNRQAVPASLRAGAGNHVPGGRLRPGRAAGDCPPVGRPGPHRRHDLRCGRAPYGGRGRLRHPARGSDAHPARVLQNGLLRPRVRHGGLRPEPAPRCPSRGGGRHHGELLRRLPAREAVHGRDGGRGEDPGRHLHRCSGASARFPTFTPPTTGCARRPSARR